MASAVWKYTLAPICSFKMPLTTEPLSVGVQGNDLILWALVDKKYKEVVRHFRVFATGQEIDDEAHLNFIGTTQMPNGLVWHVFEYREHVPS